MGTILEMRGLAMKALFVSVLGILLLPKIAWAQSVIVPDDTLGSERSQVITVPGLPVEAIGGGAQRGQNLFHSFREFNVDNGRGAYFAIPNLDIRNVLTRVTGSNRSEILGTIGTFLPTTGAVRVPNVNLFLINPNGILFGENASLDVGASFFATTASGMRLGDGVFSATQPERPADVLTIVPSAFLFGSATPGKIEVRSRSTQTVLGDRTLGLQVPDGETLLLLGGDVVSDGGVILADGGLFEVVAISGSGQIGHTENGIQVPDEVQRADVLLRRNTRTEQNVPLQTSAQSGGISITARNIRFLDGSTLRAGISSGFGSEVSRSGDIRLDATGEVRLEQESFIGSDIAQNATGNSSGSLIIKAKSLIVTGGSQLSTSTFGKGDSGNILITASDQVVFQGTSVDGRFASSATSNVGFSGLGDGGNLVITASTLKLLDGAQLSARIFGNGDGGDVLITVRDRVSVQGTSTNRQFPSGITSNVLSGGVGKGGNVKITARLLEVLDGGRITSAISGLGDGGDISILASDSIVVDGSSLDGQFSSRIASILETEGLGGGGNIVIQTGTTLNIGNGGSLTATTQGRGDGGQVTIFAGDAITISSSGSALFTSTASDGRGGNIGILASALKIENGAQFLAFADGRGSGGSINIDLKDRLEIVSGGLLNTTTSSDGEVGKVTINAGDLILISGNDQLGNPSNLSINFTPASSAGEITLNTPNLTLDNNGEIRVSAPSGNGGNLKLNIPDFLLLRRGSKISAEAGSVSRTGNGGNIDINTRFMIAIPQENSDITANAFTGDGGNINISARGVFGFKFPDQPTPQSDITASSDRGITGTISLTTPDNSAIQNNLSQLSTNNINPDQLIAKTCIVRQNDVQGRFAITGNTNLPNSPGTIAPSTYATATIQTTKTIAKSDRPWKLGDPIIEPTGFYRLADDRLVLGRECAASPTP